MRLWFVAFKEEDNDTNEEWDEDWTESGYAIRNTNDKMLLQDLHCNNGNDNDDDDDDEYEYDDAAVEWKVLMIPMLLVQWL